MKNLLKLALMLLAVVTFAACNGTTEAEGDVDATEGEATEQTQDGVEAQEQEAPEAEATEQDAEGTEEEMQEEEMPEEETTE